MPIKAQYNNGTGKAKYTAGTSKQQSYDTNAILADCTYCQAPCGYCIGEQPEYIDVTFSDITEYTGCCRRGPLSFKINNSVVSSITGNTFRLSYSPSPFPGCVYATAPPPSGSIYEYGTIDCTGTPPVNRNITSFHIALTILSATTFTLTASHLVTPGYGVVSFKFIHETFLSGDCFDIDGKVVDNDTTACVSSAIGIGGTATITLPSSSL